jgi:putative nucleotidyltransferase with HDIG domain
MSLNPLPPYRTLNRLFLNHIRSFGEVDERVRAHFNLKIQHTYEVVRNIKEIARQEGMDEQTVQMASIIALLHDIGRFRQFMDFGTFNDTISLNHAELSVSLLYEEGFNQLIPDKELSLISHSILQHNQPIIPDDHTGKVSVFSRLLRDADKIDIWKLQSKMDVVYTLGEFESVDHYDVPREIYCCFLETRIVRIEQASSVNDFRLLRLGWIFDMNFPATFRHLIQKDYASMILARIPDSERLREIAGIIHTYMRQRAKP